MQLAGAPADQLGEVRAASVRSRTGTMSMKKPTRSSKAASRRSATIAPTHVVVAAGEPAQQLSRRRPAAPPRRGARRSRPARGPRGRSPAGEPRAAYAPG